MYINQYMNNILIYVLTNITKWINESVVGRECPFVQGGSAKNVEPGSKRWLEKNNGRPEEGVDECVYCPKFQKLESVRGPGRFEEPPPPHRGSPLTPYFSYFWPSVPRARLPVTYGLESKRLPALFLGTRCNELLGCHRRFGGHSTATVYLPSTFLTFLFSFFSFWGEGSPPTISLVLNLWHFNGPLLFEICFVWTFSYCVFFS